MQVIYDPISKMFSLCLEEDVIFLGPTSHAIALLQKKYKLSYPLAKEVCTKAIADIGAPVDVNVIRRYIPNSK